MSKLTLKSIDADVANVVMALRRATDVITALEARITALEAKANACQRCNGTGKKAGGTCYACDGSGVYSPEVAKRNFAANHKPKQSKSRPDWPGLMRAYCAETGKPATPSAVAEWARSRSG